MFIKYLSTYPFPIFTSSSTLFPLQLRNNHFLLHFTSLHFFSSAHYLLHVSELDVSKKEFNSQERDDMVRIILCGVVSEDEFDSDDSDYIRMVHELSCYFLI